MSVLPIHRPRVQCKHACVLAVAKFVFDTILDRSTEPRPRICPGRHMFLRLSIKSNKISSSFEVDGQCCSKCSGSAARSLSCQGRFVRGSIYPRPLRASVRVTLRAQNGPGDGRTRTAGGPRVRGKNECSSGRRLH